jgi:hypothetical protein
LLLIPYRRAVLISPRGASEVLARLAQRTGRAQLFRRSKEKLPFTGKIDANAFRLAYNEPGTNTYAPWIRGTVDPIDTGARVTTIATLHPAAWFILVALIVFARSAFGAWGWVLLIWAAFHIVMCVIGFWPTLRRADAVLREVVDDGGLAAEQVH